MDSSATTPFVPQPQRIVEFSCIAETRKEQRRLIAEAWKAEEPCTEYRYNVELCPDNRKIYLLRPTFLNKGIDFTIYLEGFKQEGIGRKSDRPSHDHIIADLALKREESLEKYEILVRAIDEVYQCVEPRATLQSNPVTFAAGLPAETVLKLVKWLFIEQDITYWGWSGRRMFRSSIAEIGS